MDCKSRQWPTYIIAKTNFFRLGRGRGTGGRPVAVTGLTTIKPVLYMLAGYRTSNEAVPIR